jgi:hypothetical protein
MRASLVFFAVDVMHEGRFIPSRSFRTLFAARKWARRFPPAKITRHVGTERVEVF